MKPVEIFYCENSPDLGDIQNAIIMANQKNCVIQLEWPLSYGSNVIREIRVFGNDRDNDVYNKIYGMKL